MQADVAGTVYPLCTNRSLAFRNGNTLPGSTTCTLARINPKSNCKETLLNNVHCSTATEVVPMTGLTLGELTHVTCTEFGAISPSSKPDM